MWIQSSKLFSAIFLLQPFLLHPFFFSSSSSIGVRSDWFHLYFFKKAAHPRPFNYRFDFSYFFSVASFLLWMLLLFSSSFGSLILMASTVLEHFLFRLRLARVDVCRVFYWLRFLRIFFSCSEGVFSVLEFEFWVVDIVWFFGGEPGPWGSEIENYGCGDWAAKLDSW